MIDKSEAGTTRRYSRPLLTWIDFLVIAAIILTFAAIVSTTVGRARASTHNVVSAPTFSSEISQIPADPNLIKAKIRLAIGGPWT
jgi:hypothetical protein